MENTNKTVKVYVMNENGHDTILMSPQEISDYVKSEQVKDRWVFINGNLVNNSQINEKSLTGVDEITITHPIVGG